MTRWITLIKPKATIIVKNSSEYDQFAVTIICNYTWVDGELTYVITHSRMRNIARRLLLVQIVEVWMCERSWKRSTYRRGIIPEQFAIQFFNVHIMCERAHWKKNQTCRLNKFTLFINQINVWINMPPLLSINKINR